MFELILLKILLQISLFLLQTVPKCYVNIQYKVKNLVKMIFKPPSPKKLLFLIRPNPKKFQICNGDIYEIWLTLLCETMTYFSRHPKLVRKQCISLFQPSYLSVLPVFNFSHILAFHHVKSSRHFNRAVAQRFMY